MTERQVMAAAMVVERHFPPATVADTRRVLAALNLLNAAVKEPSGRRLTSYRYIKGMAGCLFLWLLYHPMDGVRIFWDVSENVTYFKFGDCQFSFHYVPLMEVYSQVIAEARLAEVCWDGVERQRIALQLFEQAVMGMPRVSMRERDHLRRLMLHFGTSQLESRLRGLEGVDCSFFRRHRQRLDASGQPVARQGGRVRCIAHNPISLEPRNLSGLHFRLRLALKFNIWRMNHFELHRPFDSWHVRMVRYTGLNYAEVRDTLVRADSRVEVRPPQSLVKGRIYYLRRTDRVWIVLSPAQHLLMLAHYCFVRVRRKYMSLCVTYGLARYLGYIYPELRFINVLNYSRMTVHRRLYTYRQLLRVPLGSKSRQLKVWMVVDRDFLLRDFPVGSLPQPLVSQYEQTPDYTQFFEIERGPGGKKGLKAYSRFHLLPKVYDRIILIGHYAQVMNAKGQWAIYSLLLETFVTDFIYERLWYDNERAQMLGRVNGVTVVIHKMYSQKLRWTEP